MDRLQESILQALAPYPSIHAALLFGSLSRGKPRPGSDLDLAVLTAGTGAGPRRKMMTALMSALSDLSPSGKVDLVFLDEAPPALRQRIMEEGKLLFCRDRRAWARWRERTMREYFDMEIYRRAYMAAQKKRLLERRRSGRSPKIIESLKRTGRLPD